MSTRLPSIDYIRRLAKMAHEEGLLAIQVPLGAGHIVVTSAGYKPTIGAAAAEGEKKSEKPEPPDPRARLLPGGVDPDVMFGRRQ